MSDYLIMLIVVLASIPAAVLILRLIFGKSVMFTVSLWTVLFSIFCCYLYFVIGKLGLKNVLWATPVSFAIGTLVYLYLNKILRKPLESSIHNVKQLSDGDLTINLIESRSKNELGILINSIKQLVENLNTIMSNIISGAEQVANASLELSTSSQMISQGANEQAASVEEVSSTMEEIASNIENLNTPHL